jgi:ATP-binding cassette, subfamily F, member 3
MLEKQEDLNKLSEIQILKFNFNFKPFPSRYLLSADRLSFSYNEDDKLLIDNFSLSIKKGDKICIIGQNGKGKTTLMKLLNNSLEIFSGKIEKHPEIEIGYFAQEEGKFMNPNNTVEQEIYLSNENCNNQDARNICGAFMFSSDDALKKISMLSGGEKSRLLFAKLLTKQVNLLLIDEPTNHLDIESCEALAEAINNFQGAVVLITHNENLLKSVSNRLVIFDRNKVTVYEGNYAEFLDSIGWENDTVIQPQKTKSVTSLSKKEIRQRRADIINQKNAELSPIKKEIDFIENEIKKQEKIISDNDKTIIEASKNNESEKIIKFSIDNDKLRHQVNAYYEKLEPLLSEYEKLSKKYDTKLLK